MKLTPIALLMAGYALANTHSVQANDEGVERITVRGAYFGQQVSDSVKTPTLLINVPQSVSIISAEQIQDQANQSVADILQYSPGISTGQGEGHRDQITLRGQNTTADFFIDGLRDDVQYFRPLYNLERIEIMRGANALLFGRGGAGGIVNRVTKEAHLRGNSASIAGGLDTFGAGTFSVDTNLTVGATQALRFNAYAENIDSHRDFADGERYALNPTYKWQISDETTLVASYEYLQDERLVDRGVPADNGAPLEGQRDTYFGAKDFNSTSFNGHISRVRIDHLLDENWSVNSTLQYADYDKFYQNVYPAKYVASTNLVTFDGYADATERQNLLLQFNAVGQFDTGSLTHTVLAGFEYGQQDTENNRADINFAATNDDQIEVDFSNPIVVPEFSLTLPVRDRASEVEFTSLFVQDEISLNDQWRVVAGLRYDRFDIDVEDYIEANNGVADGNSGILGRRDNEVSPRAGIIYKPSDDVSIYVSYSHSFLPRSGDQFLTLSLSTQALAPEEFINKEAGIKWNISETLSLSGALFRVKRENGTATDPNNPERTLLTGTETNGFEIELVGEVTDTWRVNAGYSYLDADELGRVANGTISNRTLAQVPQHMFSLWNDWTVNDKWRAALGVVYQAEQYASLSNAVTLPDFVRVDAALYYQVSEQTKVQLNIENVFDENYFVAAHNDNNISTGEPLNARLSFNYQF